MKNKNVLFLGALSDIAKSTVHKFGENGYNLQLAARNLDDLKKISADLKIRYNVDINIYEFDILKTENHQNFIKDLKEIPSIIICAVGFMGEQKESEKIFCRKHQLLIESHAHLVLTFHNSERNLICAQQTDTSRRLTAVACR